MSGFSSYVGGYNYVLKPSLLDVCTRVSFSLHRPASYVKSGLNPWRLNKGAEASVCTGLDGSQLSSVHHYESVFRQVLNKDRLGQLSPRHLSATIQALGKVLNTPLLYLFLLFADATGSVHRVGGELMLCDDVWVGR